MGLTDVALAACPPGTICVSVATDTGNAAEVGTFSWAITQANAGGNQTIGFDDAVFTGPTPTLVLSGTAANTPRVTASVTIDGSNVPNLVIDGSGQREILLVRADDPSSDPPIQVSIANVTLQNGRAEGGRGGGGAYGGGGGMGAGGAIFVGAGASVVATNVTLVDNVARGGSARSGIGSSAVPTTASQRPARVCSSSSARADVVAARSA